MGNPDYQVQGPQALKKPRNQAFLLTDRPLKIPTKHAQFLVGVIEMLMTLMPAKGQYNIIKLIFSKHITTLRTLNPSPIKTRT